MTTATDVNSLETADVEELVSMVWESVLELPVHPSGESAPDESVPEDSWLAGTIELTGSWPGRVSVAVPSALAGRAAAALFGLHPEDADDADRRDAIGELTNMTGGNLKALIDGTNQLGLPAVGAAGRRWEDDPSTHRDWWFDAGGDTFVVRVSAPEPSAPEPTAPATREGA